MTSVVAVPSVLPWPDWSDLLSIPGRTCGEAPSKNGVRDCERQTVYPPDAGLPPEPGTVTYQSDYY